MVLPEKLTTMKSEELREECHVRNIDSDGLSREQEGIIERSYSDWAAPIVIVPKQQDGITTGIRICVDMRRLNSVSNFDAYPLPRIEDLIEQLGEAKFISKLDLTKGYWQIPLSTETKEKSAFITPYGLYLNLHQLHFKE